MTLAAGQSGGSRRPVIGNPPVVCLAQDETRNAGSRA
jgi:hypothetical protein